MAALKNSLLIITNKDDFTSDFLIKRLRELDLTYTRLNTESFPLNINSSIFLDSDNVQINIQNDRWNLSLSDILSIWYRRPILSDFSEYLNNTWDIEFAIRESWEYLQNLWLVLRDKPWVNDPYILRISEKKLYQLKVAADVGLQTPATLVTNNSEEANFFYKKHNKKIIAKPLSHGGYGENEKFAIFTTDLESIAFDFSCLKLGPSIFQEKVQKKADVRVSIFGNQMFAYLIYANNNEIDWRKLPPQEQIFEPYCIPLKIKNKLFLLMKKLKLSFSAVDFCIDNNGNWIFLEVNPNGQWAWFDVQNQTFEMTDALIGLLYDKR